MCGWNVWYNKEGALQAGPAYLVHPAHVTEVTKEALEVQRSHGSVMRRWHYQCFPKGPTIMSQANRTAKTLRMHQHSPFLRHRRQRRTKTSYQTKMPTIVAPLTAAIEDPTKYCVFLAPKSL